MSPLREAIGLPVLFLTVALLGGFRLPDGVRLVPPSLTALILAVLFLGVLARAGAIFTSCAASRRAHTRSRTCRARSCS